MGIAKKQIAIIGGGVTGLATAYFLQEALQARKGEGLAVELILIESESRLGGKIVTLQQDGFVIEGGPDSFITQKPWGMALCRKLGISDQVIETDRTNSSIYLFSHGALHPLPRGFGLIAPGQITPFLTTPLISTWGKIRMMLDCVIPPRKSSEDESIAAFVRRRLGSEAVLLFAEPILGGIYAGDVERLSIRATFPQFPLMEQTVGSLIRGLKEQQKHAKEKTTSPLSTPMTLFVTLQGGLQGLVDAISENIKMGVTVMMGQPVQSLRRKDGGYEIALSDKRIQADAIVITTDTKRAAGWTKIWDATLTRLLQQIEYVSTATVSLGFLEGGVIHPMNGFGFVVPRREGKRTLAATFSSSKFSGRAPTGARLIRAFLGGSHNEALVERADQELIELVREEWATTLGFRSAPVVAHVTRWIKANPQYHVGHLDLVADIEQRVAIHPGLFLAGAAYRGVGIPDCIRQGEEAAQKVIQYVGGLFHKP